MHSAYPSQQVDMSWLSTINHTSSFCYGASCCPWLEFACENGGSRSRSRYVSRSQADTGQHLRPSEVAQCAKAFVHPAIAWGFRGNFVEISDGFADLSFWIQYNACDVWLLYCIIYRLVLGGGTDSKTQLQLHVPGWRKIRREEKSKGHDGHDSQSIPDPYGYPAIHTGSRVKGVFGMCLVSRILWSASLKIRASMQDVLVVCLFCLLIYPWFVRIYCREFYWWNDAPWAIDMVTNGNRIMTVLLEHWRQDKGVATENDDPELPLPQSPQNGGVL